MQQCVIKKGDTMEEKIKDAIEKYQCSGCVCGSDVSCYKPSETEACGKHVVGTAVTGIGKIFLGMPKGFNRLGPAETMAINIFKSISDGWKFDFLNIPVWKYLDSNGNTIVRGISPRINSPFLHVFLGDCMDNIDCAEITNDDLDGMD
jgi:hypothetical protein